MKVRHLALALGIVAVLAIAMVAHDAEPPLARGAAADRILIEKSDRTLKLLSGPRVLKTYHVAFGREPRGKKTRQGDDRTPEGVYAIDYRNPNSKYHLALHVSYPNAEDRQRARAGGWAPGGDVMIHGLPNKVAWIGRLHRFVNWTHGCIAVTDAEVDEIGRAVKDGTPVEIRP